MDKQIRVLHVIGIMNRGGAETMIMNLYRHIDRSKVQFDFVENSSEPTAAAVQSLFLVTIVCHHKDNFADHILKRFKVFRIGNGIAVLQKFF